MKLLISRFKTNGTIKKIEEISKDNFDRLKANPEFIFNHNTNDRNNDFVFIMDTETDECSKETLEQILHYACSKKNYHIQDIMERLEYIADDISELSADFDSLKSDFKLLKKSCE